jgi:hypothetical protein
MKLQFQPETVTLIKPNILLLLPLLQQLIKFILNPNFQEIEDLLRTDIVWELILKWLFFMINNIGLKKVFRVNYFQIVMMVQF